MVLVAAEICEDKKGTDTRILELDPADAGFTDFFLITSGSNTRQTGAIADEIELRMKREFGTYAKSVEGRRSGEWILLDYIDFVVHIFTEETREFYDIERLRKSARLLDTQELAAALKKKTEAARKKAPATEATAKHAETGSEAPPALKKAAKKAPATKLSKEDFKDESEAPTGAPKKVAGRKKPAKPAGTTLAAPKKAAKKASVKKRAERKTQLESSGSSDADSSE